MRTLVFDIETIGEKYEKMDVTTQEVLTHWLHKTSATDEEFEAGLEDIKNGLGFSPYTGEIVAIGLYDLEHKKGVVYYQAPEQHNDDEEHDGVVLKQMTEREMLEAFWKGAREYEVFVTFNGRAFDAPFLAVRSAVHQMRPTCDLLSNRYLSLQRGCKHVDLLDQLSFYGAVWKGKPNLHLACRAFNIPSPKAQGVTGDDVAMLFSQKRYKDIAQYNIRDILSTAQLYEYWCTYLRA